MILLVHFHFAAHVGVIYLFFKECTSDYLCIRHRDAFIQKAHRACFDFLLIFRS